MKIRRDSISFCRLPLFAVLSGVVLLGLSSVGEVRADEVQRNTSMVIRSEDSIITNDTVGNQVPGATYIDTQTCEIKNEHTISLVGCENGIVTQITRLPSELADIDLGYWTPLTDMLIATYPILANIDSISPNDPINRELCGTRR